MSEGPLENACYRAIGERICTLRTAQGMSQVELADKVHLTRTSITNIEAGRQKPLPHTLYLFAYALHVSVHDLMPPHLNDTLSRMALDELAAMLHIDTSVHSTELEEMARTLQTLAHSEHNEKG